MLQKQETLGQFQAKMEWLTMAANFPTMTAGQAIMLHHTDILTKKHIGEERDREFEHVFKKTYKQALDEIKQIHSKTVEQKPFVPICFKCGLAGHKADICEAKNIQCLIPTCNSKSHNTKGHGVMETVGIAVIPDKIQKAFQKKTRGPETKIREYLNNNDKQREKKKNH